jgi:hypothetical protein
VAHRGSPRASTPESPTSRSNSRHCRRRRPGPALPPRSERRCARRAAANSPRTPRPSRRRSLRPTFLRSRAFSSVLSSHGEFIARQPERETNLVGAPSKPSAQKRREASGRRFPASMLSRGHYPCLRSLAVLAEPVLSRSGRLQGEVPERSNGAVSKTVVPLAGDRGFESLPLRHFTQNLGVISISYMKTSPAYPQIHP